MLRSAIMSPLVHFVYCKQQIRSLLDQKTLSIHCDVDVLQNYAIVLKEFPLQYFILGLLHCHWTSSAMMLL